MAGCLIGMVAMAQELKDSSQSPLKRYIRHRITMIYDENMMVMDSTCKVDSVYMTEDGKLMFKFSNGKKFSLGSFENGPKIPKHYPNIYSGLYFGVNSFMNPDMNFKLEGRAKEISVNTGRSFVFSMNPFEQALFAARRQVNMITGLGLMVEKYQFENTYIYLATSNGVMQVQYDSLRGQSRNYFTNTSLEIPLLLRVATRKVKNAREAFQVAIGVSGQWRFRTRQTLEYQRQGVEIEENGWNSFGQEAFTVNGIFRVQYKEIGVFAKVGLNPMFKGGTGAVAQVVPFSAGVRVGFD